MASFIIDESHLRRLSPETRRELLQVLSSDLSEIKRELADQEWDPEGNLSFPLSPEGARILIRGMPNACRHTLRVFAQNYDGEIGLGELEALLEAGGYSSYDALGQEVSHITQRLRSITGDADAWLFNWRARDWEWDEHEQTYTRGLYFISNPAVASLRDAFGMSDGET